MMLKQLRGLSLIFSASLFLLLTPGCGGKKGDRVYRDQVVIHALSNPQGLNAHTTSDAQASAIKDNLYQTLLMYDMEQEDMGLIPWVAKSRPEVSLTPTGGMEITYEIREEAAWDDGSPITAADVIFSLKAIKCPKVNTDHLKPYLEFISDIRTYADNPRKLTFVSTEKYMMAEDVTGNSIRLIQEKLYDPKGLLKGFSISQLNNPTEAILNHPNVKEFSDYFNSETYNREPQYISGSGAYRFVSWQTGQRLILERKENWWGDKLEKESFLFEAYPKRLVFEVVNDFNTALTAVKDQKIDVISVTPVKEYLDLDKSAAFKANYIKSEPIMLSYTYLGLNVRDKILSDKKVRQALAQLINADLINEKLLYGQQFRIIGEVNPMNKADYNNDLKPYEYNPDAARKLLEEAGWKDTDGDGVLDKVINGVKTPFFIKYNYNSGNPIREAVGLMMQEWFKQAGIRMEVAPIEWVLYLEELKKNNIQMYYGGWIQSPSPNDPKQIWHSTSRNGGSNYTGFGNAESDALIESIRAELDPAKRSELMKKWQALMHDECAYIYLFGQKSRNVIHKRFENLRESPVYPGHWPASFKVKKEYKTTTTEAENN
jgi:peptide/nickel transport system substrate-binding protein